MAIISKENGVKVMKNGVKVMKGLAVLITPTIIILIVVAFLYWRKQKNKKLLQKERKTLNSKQPKMAKWTIWKGWHFSLSNIWERFIPRIGTGPVTYTFKLPKETWFPYVDKDDMDINKLAGYSYGWHHNDSIRIGWIPDFGREGYFTLYFYIYNNGVRKMTKFETVIADVDYSLKISLVPGINYVTFDMIGGYTPVKASETFVIPKCKIGYSLWWYFGGNKTAQKKMVAWLKAKF